jgi:uncharacterized protein YeaO (DUF488 family)
VRRPPRGVKKSDYARLDFYDAWLPELSPSPALVKWMMGQDEVTEARWRRFVRGYRAEMRKAEAQHLLETLARLSHGADFSVGCYCEDFRRCHRSILYELLREHGAKLADPR